MNKSIAIGVIAIAAIAGLLFAFHQSSVGSAQVNYNARATTTVTAASASTQIMSTSTSRSLVRIVNSTATGEWIGWGVPAVKGYGDYLAPGATIVLDFDHMFVGSAFMIPDSGTATTTVTEFKQGY